MSGTTLTGRDIVTSLGGKWTGKEGSCRCPAHNDKTPSLHVNERNGKILVHCHAGCAQSDVIAVLREMDLWDGEAGSSSAHWKAYEDVALPSWELDDDDLDRREDALRIWRESSPIKGTIAESYLRGRSIHRPIPPSIRFHKGLRHPQAREILPAMISAVQDERGKIVAIQRTFMNRDGSRLAGFDRKFSIAPMLNGAVRLDAAEETLGWAEGVETGLSASEMYQVPVWVSLGTARLSKGNVYIPPQVQNIIIFGDNGEAGLRAAMRATNLFRSMGLLTQAIFPPEDISDFNDLAQRGRHESTTFRARSFNPTIPDDSARYGLG